jgi:hypothetical protein
VLDNRGLVPDLCSNTLLHMESRPASLHTLLVLTISTSSLLGIASPVAKQTKLQADHLTQNTANGS